MSDIAIRVENIGKQYQIGSAPSSYRTFRETINDTVAAPFRRLGRLVRGNTSVASERNETFWALRDVSFEVKQGEVLGIIGRNGAGKSTLLKLLSRITEPTEGHIELHGRVGSLLEVGTGFHPELTGRENIFLNGAILGMRRNDIVRKFDEIVEFAEISRFLDTPVKRYSSGMYMRLAFSVAAHLEPDILVVDEVLAVGDAAFQKKCIGKMQEVGGNGRTVLFVSHNMGAIKQLCSRTLYLKKGRVQSLLATEKVISQYISDGLSSQDTITWSGDDSDAGDQHLRFQSVSLQDNTGKPTSDFDVLESIFVVIHYKVDRSAPCRLTVWLYSSDGLLVFVTGEMDSAEELPNKTLGTYKATCRIPGHLLNKGHYFVGLRADIPNYKVIASIENALSFRVHATSGVAARRDGVYGVICPQINWQLDQINKS